MDAQGFAISITPDFPHRFRLAGTSILQIQGQMPADTFSDGIELKEGDAVEHRLPRSSEMTVSIPDGFTTPNGLTLKRESVTIRTPEFIFSREHWKVLILFPLRIAFDQPIDLSKFQSAFRIGGGRIENASEVSTRYGTTENSGKRQEDMTLVDARPPENFGDILKPIVYGSMPVFLELKETSKRKNRSLLSFQLFLSHMWNRVFLMW